MFINLFVHTEEDRYGSYSRLLMKYFLSEGVMCGHTLLLGSANENTEDILKVRGGFYRRASVASETLTGVTQLKIGGVCVFICMDVRMSFCTLTPVFLLKRGSVAPPLYWPP